MALLVHPLYNFLKYSTKALGYHTGWYMDLHENDIAVVDFDIVILSEDIYVDVLDKLRKNDGQICIKIGEDEIMVRQQEAGVLERLINCNSESKKKEIIRDYILRNTVYEYGQNDYVVITGSGGLHFYYKYNNKLYNQRNIKCIKTIFYEVDILLGGPNHSFVVCPKTVAVKNGILGEYKSPCLNFNDAFPSPYKQGVDVSDNINTDSLKRFDDIPETEMLNSYAHFRWIKRDLVYKGRVYNKEDARDQKVILPSDLNPLPEELLEFCSYAHKDIVKDWEFMVSRPEKTIDSVFRKNREQFYLFVMNLIQRGIHIHCTAHPGSNYTSQLTLLHLLGCFSNFNDDMRAEFFRILKDNPKALTPNAYRNLTKPHKRVKQYSKYTLGDIINYYTGVDAHFYF